MPMVSQGGSPPVPMPVQVPAGHVMQQMVDEHGQLRHVFLSTAHPPPPQPVGVPAHMQSHYVSLGWGGCGWWWFVVVGCQTADCIHLGG